MAGRASDARRHGTGSVSAPVRRQEHGETAMRGRGSWWVGLLLLMGVVGGCGGDDHDDAHHGGAVCVVFGEVEPNATPLTAQFLGDLFVDDCVIVDGSLFDPADVDSYRVLV